MYSRYPKVSDDGLSQKPTERGWFSYPKWGPEEGPNGCILEEPFLKVYKDDQ